MSRILVVMFVIIILLNLSKNTYLLLFVFARAAVGEEKFSPMLTPFFYKFITLKILPPMTY